MFADMSAEQSVPLADLELLSRSLLSADNVGREVFAHSASLSEALESSSPESANVSVSRELLSSVLTGFDKLSETVIQTTVVLSSIFNSANTVLLESFLDKLTTQLLEDHQDAPSATREFLRCVASFSQDFTVPGSPVVRGTAVDLKEALAASEKKRDEHSQGINMIRAARQALSQQENSSGNGNGNNNSNNNNNPAKGKRRNNKKSGKKGKGGGGNNNTSKGAAGSAEHAAAGPSDQ
jgi:hypothetical protein